jgi:hypothetical protein
MGGVFNHYVIREHPDYTELLGQLCASENVRLAQFRQALSFTFHILSLEPQVYPEVAMTEVGPIRLAKTELFRGDGLSVPALQLSFIVWEHEKTVELLKIEKRTDSTFVQ